MGLFQDFTEGSAKIDLVKAKRAMDLFAEEGLKFFGINKKVKEELRMTELGKSLIQEGIEKGIKQGIEKGKEKGKAELLIKMLMQKFKKVPNNYKEKIKILPEETIELIATDIFELNSVEELEKYF